MAIFTLDQIPQSGRSGRARTVLLTPVGKPTVVDGEHEDRMLTAEDGWFTDDFTGVDLYQRYGGEWLGYGNSPVALHICEVGM